MNTMELLRIEDTARRPAARRMGEYRPDLVPGLVQRSDIKALDDRPAGGRLVHPRRQRAALAELVDAAGLQLPRGPGHPPGRLHDGDERPPDRAPAVLRRDGRPLPRPEPRPPPPHRLRHRRVGPGLHDDVARARAATASARSPTSTPSCTTAAASRTRSPTPSACTRRTTACCGSTSTRRPAPRSAGRGGWSSPSTRPWPTTSTSSTGASTRTARSSARSAPPGSW